MRVIAGIYRGRRLTSPRQTGLGRAARPTTERVREALFNILAHGQAGRAGATVLDGTNVLDGAIVLDAFCASGALGFEALSRGARRVVFVDTDAAAIACVRANARELDAEDRVSVLRADATLPPTASEACTLALLDPPYGTGLAQPALAALAKAGWLAADALVVLEAAASEAFVPPMGFTQDDTRRYGKTALHLLRFVG